MTSSISGKHGPASVPTVQEEGSTDLAGTQLATQWARIRGSLQQEVGDMLYRNWLRDMTLVDFNDGVLTIMLRTQFRSDWVRTNYADRLLSLWQAENPAVQEIDFVFSRGEPAMQELPPDAPAPRLEPSPVLAVDRGDAAGPFDDRFAFESFVVGKPNEFAYACARRVAERPASKGFNPLFLYGGVGLGKTHLMHAIGLELSRREGPAARVTYMSAESFMRRFITAIRGNTTLEFKEQLRSQDVLMIDDIQFLIGKESTQEEFFHTFNALVDAGRQIVVSADKSPAALDGIEGRLSTRLGCGMVADLHATTFELRLSILTAKAAGAEIPVPPKVLEFLAHKINTNVRELEGALNRIVAHASMFGREITLEGTHDVLRDLLKAHDRRVSIEDIQKRVAQHWGVRLTDMTSARRSRNVARPRQVAIYLAKQCTDRSLPEIGRMFGNRDHTTVIHAVKRVTSLMKEDPDFRENVELLHELLRR